MEEGPVHGDQAEEGPQLEDEVKGGQREMTLVTSDPSGMKEQLNETVFTHHGSVIVI